jgi:hypothetical protein
MREHWPNCLGVRNKKSGPVHIERAALLLGRLMYVCYVGIVFYARVRVVDMKSDAEQIREYAGIRYIEPARHNGETTVRIKSGDIVKGLGLKNKTPNVCTALRSKIFQKQYGLQLVGEQGPPSGMSTTVVFTYKILGKGNGAGSDADLSGFHRLRGIANKTFQKLGGGERFIRREREGFYGNADDVLRQGKRAGKRG